jgi:DNA-binding transcriptional LysR family regulator
MVLLPKLTQFARTYPEIVLEVTSSNDPVGLVAGEYDIPCNNPASTLSGGL